MFLNQYVTILKSSLPRGNSTTLHYMSSIFKDKKNSIVYMALTGTPDSDKFQQPNKQINKTQKLGQF